MSFEFIKNIQEQVDKNETIKMLRSALADEFNAGTNYWIQGKVIEGVNEEQIKKELFEHRDEEFEHANLLINRILQLGGNPEVMPYEWDHYAACKYVATREWNENFILEAALDGERCAVNHYQKIADFVRNKDITTYDVVMKIIDDEHEHIEDLSKLLVMVQENKKKG
jgi:bacterioferritin